MYMLTILVGVAVFAYVHGPPFKLAGCFKKSKIRSMVKWPLRGLRSINTIEIWYLNENELISDFWGHIVLKQPRNHKFEIGYAQAKSAKLQLNQYADFFSSRSFVTCTNSKS